MSDEHNKDHDDELDDLEEGDDEDDTVILSDAEGNETEYQFLAIIEVDGESYALLTPTDTEEGEDSVSG